MPSLFGGEGEGIASPPFRQLETLDLGRNAFTGSPPGGAGMKGAASPRGESWGLGPHSLLLAEGQGLLT